MRLISGLDSTDIKPQIEQWISEKREILVFQDNEELNRVFMLTIARWIHRTGEFAKIIKVQFLY